MNARTENGTYSGDSIMNQNVTQNIITLIY